MKKLSRMESNKEVRRVLNRNGVDLSYCQYSCFSMEVVLSGWLCKHDGSEFTGHQVQALISDMARYMHGYSIKGEFDNWKFNTERITYVGEKTTARESASGGAEEQQKVYEIDLDEFDF